MSAAHDIKLAKVRFRKIMRKKRHALHHSNPSPNLRQTLPELGSFSPIVAGYAPIGTEIDIWPLLKFLHEAGQSTALPVIAAPDHPLIFREWTPLTQMEKDAYGVEYPSSGSKLTPELIFVPLLAFTSKGERLGYGGGFYDRTLDTLRAEREVFACGVAYAGQEVEELPTDAHDAKLDGILTEDGFRTFA